MKQVFLSDTELFYAKIINDKIIDIFDDEANHIANVMRFKEGDYIYVTEGKGKIFNSKIILSTKKNVRSEITDTINYVDKNINLNVFVPNLKSKERMRFMIEKLVELGITSITIYDSQRTIAKGGKIEKWEKTAIAAMKQSLRAYLPSISYMKNLESIDFTEQNYFVFDQNAKKSLSELKMESEKKYNFIFGPEGGFTEKELSLFNENQKIKLVDYRLRSETAVISAMSRILI